ncbi:MAG: ATP-binding cassette domain-containing protein, partial [Spirochaetaceae bacterium]|nr:ATP-binding cassette domain-containing protein [Spirochaetaceae bacterium]
SSVLLKTASGLITPDEGRVMAWGRDIETMSGQDQFLFHGKTGFVFQDAALWANMSGFQNITLPFQFYRRRMQPAEITACVNEMLAEFGFTANIDLRPVSFSTGEQKIISFMRAMVLEPPVLFVDDPTASIDNAAARRILGILKKRKDRGHTLIIKTNDPRYTLQLADNLVILRAGSVVEQGSFAEVRASRDPYVMETLSENLDMPDALTPQEPGASDR